jgi:GAF domain-containing protein
MEAQADGMLASVLLLDEDGTHLLHGAAPSLPEEYSEAIDGVTVGAGVGSCGHAAFTGEPIAVEDIAVHPNWAPFSALAYEDHGLRACWSTPIKSWEGKVVATFAMYYRQPKAPGLRDRKLADYSSHLVAIAIERARERERLDRLGV